MHRTEALTIHKLQSNCWFQLWIHAACTDQKLSPYTGYKVTVGFSYEYMQHAQIRSSHHTQVTKLPLLDVIHLLFLHKHWSTVWILSSSIPDSLTWVVFLSICHIVNLIVLFSQQACVLWGWDFNPLPSPQLGQARYISFPGTSLLTCLAWETLPVAVLPLA